MKTAKQLHQKAMDLAEDGFKKEAEGKPFLAYCRFKEALRLEERALSIIPKETERYGSTIYVLSRSIKYLIIHTSRTKKKCV